MDINLSLFDPNDSDDLNSSSAHHKRKRNAKNRNTQRLGLVKKTNDPKVEISSIIDANGIGVDWEYMEPEPQTGNVEYKLKLIDPSPYRLKHLISQMKWRLREGNGEAIYEIGVEDCGLIRGLTPQDLDASIRTIEKMSNALNSSMQVIRRREVKTAVNLNVSKEQENPTERKFEVARILVRKLIGDYASYESTSRNLDSKVLDDSTDVNEEMTAVSSDVSNEKLVTTTTTTIHDLRVCVLGEVDAGKSTLISVLTHNVLDDGLGTARLQVFTHLHEMRSGRTSSLSHELMGFDASGNAIDYSSRSTTEDICEASTKIVTFIDLAGHNKYLKTTLSGISGYSPHYLILAVNCNSLLSSAHALTPRVATKKSQICATSSASIIEWHLNVAIAFGIPFVVVLTKVDCIHKDEKQRVLELKENMREKLSVVGSRIPHFIESKSDAVDASTNVLMNPSIVPVISVSSVSGEGLPLLKFLLHLLPAGRVSMNERFKLESGNPEFQIEEVFDVPEVGSVVGGVVMQGVIYEGMTLSIGPFNNPLPPPSSSPSCRAFQNSKRSFENFEVMSSVSSSITFHEVFVSSIRRNRVRCSIARPSQAVALAITGLGAELTIRRGMVLIKPHHQQYHTVVDSFTNENLLLSSKNGNPDQSREGRSPPNSTTEENVIYNDSSIVKNVPPDFEMKLTGDGLLCACFTFKASIKLVFSTGNWTTTRGAKSIRKQIVISKKKKDSTEMSRNIVHNKSNRSSSEPYLWPGFRATLHIGNVRQTAVLTSIALKNSESVETTSNLDNASDFVSQNDEFLCTFKFLKHAECLKLGQRILFRQSRSTLGMGVIIKLLA